MPETGPTKRSQKIAVGAFCGGLVIFGLLTAILPFLWPLWAFVGLLAAAGFFQGYLRIAADQTIVDRPGRDERP